METQQIERTPAHSINWTHVAHFSPKNSARSNPVSNLLLQYLPAQTGIRRLR